MMETTNPIKTRLLLIRHGETAHHRLKKYCGHTDVPLNGQGVLQAELLRRRLILEAVDAVYASDRQRAHHMARLVFENRPLPIEQLCELQEIHFGAWEGLTHEQILSKDAETYRRWLDAPDQVQIPGGERLTDLNTRVMKAVSQILEKHKGKTIAVVSHSGPIKIILSQALDIPWRNLWRIRSDPASLSIVEYYTAGLLVCTMNDTSHLGGL